MSLQQLSVIVVGIFLVGLAVIAGVLWLRHYAAAANRDAIVHDLNVLGARAQQHHRRPKTTGGGDHSFAGLSIRQIMPNNRNLNGVYSASGVTSGEITLLGVGRESGHNGEPISVTLKVFADSTYLVYNN